MANFIKQHLLISLCSHAFPMFVHQVVCRLQSAWVAFWAKMKILICRLPCLTVCQIPLICLKIVREYVADFCFKDMIMVDQLKREHMRIYKQVFPAFPSLPYL